MGSITDALATAFRDYVTDGVPASGKNKPSKSEIRGIGTLIEAAIGTLTLGGMIAVTKDTRAHLNSDLAHAADSVALVYADATDANNDLYIKVGASGSGSWTLTSILHDAIDAIVAPLISDAQDAATLAGHYANDSTDTDVPGGSAGDRGAQFYALQAKATTPAVYAYMDVLAKRFDNYGSGSFVAGKADWVRTARDRMTCYFFDTRAGNDANDGLQPWKAKIDAVPVYAAQKATTSSFLFHNGQQHMFRGVSGVGYNFPQFGDVSLNGLPACIGNYGPGDTNPPLTDPRYVVTETWVNVTGNIWETTLAIETSVFGASGSPPNEATPRPMLFLKPDTTSENIGTRLPWVTGGASASANNTALAALSGVGITIRAPNGSGFETAGEVRSTGASLSSLVVRVKRPSGVNPNSERFMWVNRQSSMNFAGGWHGSFILPPGMGKDTATFGALTTGHGVLKQEMPWGEEVVVYGGAHSGVGFLNTVGKFSGIGVPVEGDPYFSKNRTAGWAVHRFNPGIDLRDQWLFNQSIYGANSQSGMAIHGLGTAGEGYRGWIVPDDITIVNCGSAVSPDLLVEAFLHYGRLDMIDCDAGVANYTTPYMRVGAKGGQFVSAKAPSSLAAFSPVNGYIIDLGSDNLAEPFWLDASAINPGAPDYQAAYLNGSGDNATYSGMNILILRNVRDKLGKAGAVANKAFRLNIAGYFVNANKIWLDLRAGCDLQNALSSNVTNLSTIPNQIPLRLSWAAGVKWGIGNHTFAEIEAAYATLGRICTIASGAIAINVAGDVIDTKA